VSEWFRVFGRSDKPPDPALLLEELQRRWAVSVQVCTDELGWIRIVVQVADASLEIERFLASEKGIRGELNTWAAWLETCADNEHHVVLMERMIQTQQLFTIHGQLEQVGEALCRRLAHLTDGIYQIDERGFFASDGTLLVPEN